jgi:DeoR/GlpR family transcriptional regulator of sugar metabolism
MTWVTITGMKGSVCMTNERQHKILQLLDLQGEVQLTQLKERFAEVSVMTLRRDLINLEKNGFLIRTHGGGVSARKLANITGEEDAYSRRAAENVEAKMKIAEKAIPLVEKGRSIYFDSGTTIMQLAKLLNDDNFSVVTSGTNISLELVKKQHVSVVMVGGLINKNTLSSSGPNAISQLETMNIDIAFMASSGFSTDNGFTVGNIYECELKRRVVKRAKKVIMLMDVSKINKDLPFTYALLKDIDIWVCNNMLPPEIQEKVSMSGVKLL